MKKADKSQYIINIIQTVLLFLTMLSAVCIGIKQNEINENLLNLNYIPSVAIKYSDKQIDVYNFGSQNIWLWGTKIYTDTANISNKPRLIPPNGSYYMLTDSLNPKIEATLLNSNPVFLPIDLYIQASNKTKYVVETFLYCMKKDDSIIVHTQTVNIIQKDWQKP